MGDAVQTPRAFTPAKTLPDPVDIPSRQLPSSLPRILDDVSQTPQAFAPAKSLSEHTFTPACQLPSSPLQTPASDTTSPEIPFIASSSKADQQSNIMVAVGKLMEKVDSIEARMEKMERLIHKLLADKKVNYCSSGKF